MMPRVLLTRFNVPVAVAFIASAMLVSAGLAQTSSTGAGPYVVRVETPGPGAEVSGNISFSGLAVDCGLHQGADWIAVFDGTEQPSNHLGDIDVTVVRNLVDGCTSRTGTATIGWNLIVDSRRLTTGSHSLTFVAHFNNGTTQRTTQRITVRNGAPSGTQQAGPLQYTSQCVVINPNGSCQQYQNVGSSPNNAPNGSRGYYTCTSEPTYRCNFTYTNGGGMRNR